MTNEVQEDLVMAARELADQLRARSDEELIRKGAALVGKLRGKRKFSEMKYLAERVLRVAPGERTTRRQYAQALIETGALTAAVDVLAALSASLPDSDAEWAEAVGLLGRAHKQLFVEAADKFSEVARASLNAAVAAYRQPYEANPAANTWHGVNLVALLCRARAMQLEVAPDLAPAVVARQVLADLEQTPEEKRDAWFHATLAEAALAESDWEVVERHLGAYVQDPRVDAFAIAGTLRQFTEIWDLEAGLERGRGLVAALRAKLISMPGGRLEIDPAQLQRMRGEAAPSDRQLQAVLGADGAKTYQWWQTGLERGRSVAAIRQKLGGRIGTGFLVKAGDFGLEPAEELLVLTNHHVVNRQGAQQAATPDEVEMVFELGQPGSVYEVEAVLCESPPDQLDMALLRPQPPISGLPALPLARALPVIEPEAKPRVYVIGHPGGRALSFSFLDNELIDHEGPPTGNPALPGVCRVHYRAPTEQGNSGSPVFNGNLWQVIALHHLGGKENVRRLNQRGGTYGANEGIWIKSVRDWVKNKAGNC